MLVLVLVIVIVIVIEIEEMAAMFVARRSLAERHRRSRWTAFLRVDHGGIDYDYEHEHELGSGGFTLAELIVASTILTIVMTAVYVAFGSTLRAWRLGEAHLHTFQDARTALNILSRELGCVAGGSEHLLQGKDDEIEFYTVSQPMDVRRGEGARVLWVKYRYNRNNHAIVRQEAIVQGALPPRPQGDSEIDRTRIKLGRKHRFDLVAKDVVGFKLTYLWMPPDERKFDEPPVWLEPIALEENREGWDLPQSIQVELTLKDDNSPTKKTTFKYQTSFRLESHRYDEKRMGTGHEAESGPDSFE